MNIPNIEGTLLTELGLLTNLEHLELKYIPLTGNNIPSEIGYLTNLKHLRLSALLCPFEISNLNNLEYMDLTIETRCFDHL
jgi:hypothetical protein